MISGSRMEDAGSLKAPELRLHLVLKQKVISSIWLVQIKVVCLFKLIRVGYGIEGCVM